MGWGIDFNVDLYIQKENFNEDINQVEDKIEEIQERIRSNQDSILMYASVSPKDIIPKNWEDEPISFIKYNINEILEDLDSLYHKLFLLEAYKNYLQDE